MIEDIFESLFEEKKYLTKIPSLLGKLASKDFSGLDFNLTDQHGKNLLILAVEKHLENGSISIKTIESLIYSSNLKHEDMYLNAYDTLMNYFEYGPKKLPLKKETIQYLLAHSNLNRINFKCENALLIALKKPELYFDYVPYLVNHSNIHLKSIHSKNNSFGKTENTNAFTEIFSLHLKDPSYDLNLKEWSRLFQSQLIDENKTFNKKEKDIFEALKKEVYEYETIHVFKEKLEKALEQKEEDKKLLKL